ncbi:MAG: 5-formyltetrahydrofolate cyclo-ligase [Cytophagales bacterium]
MTKRELRKIYLEKRLQLTETEYSNLSQRICDRFFESFDLSNIKVIHLFLPITKNKEPNTWLIVTVLQDKCPHLKIAIPKMHDGTLIHYYLDAGCKLQENKWGIFEPANGNMVYTPDIDLVLVPLLAFDKEGHRVGYGKGYYDRFLKGCKSSCKKIGLSFFNAVEKISDTTSLDFKLDDVIVP